MRSLLFLSYWAALATAAVAPRVTSWPNGPFTTDGNHVIDASGNVIIYAGVNWPGAAEAMLPEGLQYQSIAYIVSKIKELGANAIRLTYPIEMIDDIFDNGGDVSLEATLQNALGSANGTTVLNQILKNNPQFTANTTRLQVYDAVAAECAAQQVYVHLDNHVSRASWCCSADDGNTWWGDTYFNAANWRRGLAYMANHLKSWPAATSMSLRNELRASDNAAVQATYNWTTWYNNVVPAANGINSANPDLLIFFSGENYDTTLNTVTTGANLGNGQTFSLNNFSYKNKIVFEIHNYQNTATSCSSIESGLLSGGYNAMDTQTSSPVPNIAPVVMTEFGFLQDATTYQSVYSQCIKQFLTSDLKNYSGGHRGGWMQWVISGSYYIRQGVQDFDETWGLLNHDWSDWRSEAAALNFTKAMVEATLD